MPICCAVPYVNSFYKSRFLSLNISQPKRKKYKVFLVFDYTQTSESITVRHVRVQLERLPEASKCNQSFTSGRPSQRLLFQNTGSIDRDVYFLSENVSFSRELGIKQPTADSSLTNTQRGLSRRTGFSIQEFFQAVFRLKIERQETNLCQTCFRCQTLKLRSRFPP